MMLKLTKYAFLSCSIFLALTYSSFALDVDRFGERLKSAVSNNGVSIAFSAIEVDGDDVLIEGVKMTSVAQTYPIGGLHLKGVVELDDGTIRIEKTIVDDFTHQENDIKFTLKGIEIDGLRPPSESTDATTYPSVLYERAISGPAILTLDGVDIFKVANSELNIDIADDPQITKFEGAVAGIFIDLSPIKGPIAQQAIADMGYQSVRGDVQTRGDWDAKTGRVNLAEFALTLKDVGRINIALGISGYTHDLIKKLQDIEKQAANNSDPEAQQAAGLASLSLLQQLTFNVMSIRFDDASLTEKVLKLAGSKQGVSAKQTAQTAKALLPFALASLGIPDLQQQISAAVSIYLDNPQSIEIKATPPEPVSFGQIMAIAIADRRAIAAAIGVEIIANQ